MTLKWDVDWSEELKGLFFLSEVNEKKETNPILFPHSFCYRQAHNLCKYSTGKFLQVIKDTPCWNFHNFIIHDIHFYIFTFATLGEMITWLRLRPENWPAYDRRYRKERCLSSTHSMQRTQSRLWEFPQGHWHDSLPETEILWALGPRKPAGRETCQQTLHW